MFVGAIDTPGLSVYSSVAMHLPRVLVVDDEFAQRRLLCRLLGVEGYRTFSVSCSINAIGKIRRLRPDLVLADISMPGMDGIKLFKILRSHPETAAVQVILMTGKSIPECVIQAAADGLSAGQIYKKADIKGLLARIKGMLGTPAPASAHSGPDSHILSKGTVSLDLIHRTVRVDGRLVPRLAAKRFDVLLALFRHDGPMSQQELQVDVWACQCDLKTVQMTVGRLREDLKDFPALQIRTDAHTYQLLIALPGRFNALID